MSSAAPAGQPASDTDSTSRLPLTVILPAYNEAESIGRGLEELASEAGVRPADVLVVDDGSTDDTARLAGEAGARVVRHRYNQGYGAALKSGIRAATTPWVLTMDADLQHRASDVPRLCARAEDHDLVVGARTGGGSSPLWRRPGKWILGWLVRRLVGSPVPDFNSGLRLVRRDVAHRYLHICPGGFSFSTTITMAFLSRGCRVAWVPIECRPRARKSRVTVRTGFEALILVCRIACLFNPLRLFLPASALLAALGIAWEIPYAISGEGLTVASLLLLLTSVLVFLLGLVCDQISSLRLERFE